MRGDENDRNLAVLSCQPPLQLEPSYPRHAHIQDQTGGFNQLARLQEVARRMKSFRLVTDRLYETNNRFDHRPIVVHDRDQGIFGVLKFFAQARCFLNLLLANR